MLSISYLSKIRETQIQVITPKVIILHFSSSLQGSLHRKGLPENAVLKRRRLLISLPKGCSYFYFHCSVDVLVFFHAVDLWKVSPEPGARALSLIPWQAAAKLKETNTAAVVLLECIGGENYAQL